MSEKQNKPERSKFWRNVAIGGLALVAAGVIIG